MKSSFSWFGKAKVSKMGWNTVPPVRAGMKNVLSNSKRLKKLLQYLELYVGSRTMCFYATGKGCVSFLGLGLGNNTLTSACISIEIASFPYLYKLLLFIGLYVVGMFANISQMFHHNSLHFCGDISFGFIFIQGDTIQLWKTSYGKHLPPKSVQGDTYLCYSSHSLATDLFISFSLLRM